jgi:dTDP-3-amino-3,4,6-trideoxy-alpha-D-glucose transaminase
MGSVRDAKTGTRCGRVPCRCHVAVPLFDPVTPRAALRDELAAALARVLDDGRYILGPEVEAFEAELATWLGVRHVAGVANGTEAITIALRALGVGPGDEVVVPSFTFYASAEAIPPTGATPVFCDVDPETFLATPEAVRAVLTRKTKAVVLVHLFGNVAPVAEIEALGLPVLEDAAQATGSRSGDALTGSMGTIATFSFYPSKNLGALGDGGAISTGDAALAERVRTLRFHGSPDKETFTEVGYNSRLDELQAAALRVQLPHVHAWCEGRRAAGRAYAAAGLGDHARLPVPAEGADPAWNLYVVRHPRPEELAAALRDRGIGARTYYSVPAHRQPALADLGRDAVLPGTEEAARTHLALPMGAALTEEQVGEVVAAVSAAGR